MEESFIEFEHLKIKLEEIRRGTNNFDKSKVIGCGGFGNVYEGVVPHSKGRSIVAIKRLNSKYGQGEHEFWKEINMLSRYTHENLITLLGYCDEGGEKLLVYEHASNGSLDHLLSSTHLTWTQRIKICLDIAKGLSYLHNDKGTHQRILHRDIKSANILLDEKWNAKVSDLGLSRIGPANQSRTAVFTNIVGTLGYLDPMYLQNGVLSKESDVYSFGVVLFEVLCGRLGTQSRNGHLEIFVPTWKQKYQDGKLHEIIFQDLLHTMDPKSLETFSDIAFHCLHESREERPGMSLVVKELEMALEFQVHQRHEDYEEMVKGAVPPINYTSLEDLKMLLSKGVFLNGGKTWFSLNNKGKHCEMISITDCLLSYPDDFAEKFSGRFYSNDNSRFKRYLYKDYSSKLKIGVRSQFLSPLIAYTVNLVFKFFGKDHTDKQILTKLRHKLEGETKTWISDLADKREDGWYMAELYQVTSHQSVVDLEIIIDGHMWTSIIIESIDFRPLENAVEHQVLEDEKADMQLISDEDDTYWEKKLPKDYQDIIKWSKDNVQWRTKKELYSILCTGFLTNNDREWFSLDKNGKKCHMVSARATCLISGKGLTWRFLPGSRFKEVLMIQYVESHLRLVSEIKSEVVSPQATYASYLVYKLPKDISSFQELQEVSYIDLGSDDRKVGDSWYIYFVSPQTPVIGAKGNQNAHNPVNRPKLKGVPQQRSDGWMEVQVWEFQTATTSEVSPMSLEVKGSSSGYLYGLILQGIEFRPV